jgi:hypothetical protein
VVAVYARIASGGMQSSGMPFNGMVCSDGDDGTQGSGGMSGPRV